MKKNYFIPKMVIWFLKQMGFAMPGIVGRLHYRQRAIACYFV